MGCLDDFERFVPSVSLFRHNTFLQVHALRAYGQHVPETRRSTLQVARQSRDVGVFRREGQKHLDGVSSLLKSTVLIAVDTEVVQSTDATHS